MAELAYKYEDRDDYKTMRELSEKILARPKKARKLSVKIANWETTAYEYAKYTSIYSEPQAILKFLDEFPKTRLREPALWRLNNYFYNSEKKAGVFDIYRQLMKRYPDDPTLLAGYVLACSELKLDVEQGIAAGEKHFQSHPDEFNSRLTEAYATLLLTNGRDDRALEVYGQAVADKFQDEAIMLNQYAWFWALAGKNLASAEAAARKSIVLKDDANVWDTLSMVLWKQGQYAEAIAAEEKALQLVGGKNDDFEQRIKEIQADMNR
jgi:predicted Zn-dependent protease